MKKRIKEEELVSIELLDYYYSWRQETIETFEKILDELVERELYEECALVRDNLEFLRNVTLIEILNAEGEILLPFTFKDFTEETKSIFRKYYDLEAYE